jgi:serine/threonine-protein kinase
VYKRVVLGQLAPGTTIAGYEILRSLGHGGMGDVYLARREGESRSVALKLLSMGLASDTRFRDRFERESHMATSLEHPHIVPVYATGVVEGVRYIAMRYVDGPTLRDLIDDESPLDSRRTLSLLAQVASALDDAHGIGLVHRDIKPGNVLIARSGASEFREHAYLTDFGVSKYTGSESDFTRTGQFVGTSLYAAPEQIQGEPIDGRTDVYAFGCVLFECLTGRPPFEKESEPALLWAQMFERPPSLSTLRPDLAEELDGVIAKAMAKSQADRYPTCGDLVVTAREALARAQQSIAGDEVLGKAAGAATIEPVAEPVPQPPAGATVIKSPPHAGDGSPAGATVSEPAQELDEPAPVAEAESGPAERAGQTVVKAEAPAQAVPKTVRRDDVPERAAAASAAGTPTVLTDDKPVVEWPVIDPAERSSVPVPAISRPSDVAARGGRRRLLLGLVVGIGVVALGVASAIVFLGGGDGGTAANVPALVSAPAVVGTPRAGSTLTARNGSWRNAPTQFRFQWRRCNARGSGCASVRGETTRTYRVGSRDVGRRLRVAVTAVNGEGSRTGISTATTVVAAALVPPKSTAAPRVVGTAQQGSTLSLREGRWGGTELVTVVHVWLRCDSGGSECRPIAGAKGTTYTLQSQDVGRTIRVEERASNASGRSTARSRATSEIRAREPGQTSPTPSPGRPTPPDPVLPPVDP